MGKQTNASSDESWGTVQIFVYPAGTEMPPNKQTPPSVLSKSASAQPVPASTTAAPKPQ
jgi:hypothetical protein